MSAVPDIDGDGDDELLTGGEGDYDGYLDNVPTLLLGPITSMDRIDAAATYWSERGEISSPGEDTAVTDVDGDGVGELFLSRMGDTTYDGFYGAVYLVPADLRGDLLLDDFLAVVGVEDRVVVGWAIAVGDVNGDGTPDLIAEDLSGDLGGAPSSYIVTGPITSNTPLSDATTVIEASDDEIFRQAAIGGDLDGDGISGDLAMGLLASSEIHLLPAPVTAGTLTLDPTTRVAWSEDDINLGVDMQVLPDLDGDGVDDLLIGATLDAEGGTEAGAAFIVFGASG